MSGEQQAARPKPQATGPLARLILDAKASGVKDAYEFAEYLVHERNHFGSLHDETDLESAWLQAEHWWKTYVDGKTD